MFYSIEHLPDAAERMAERVTFAIVGHDEADSLATPVKLAIEAAAPGDRVWFVDSASIDDSIEVARSLGVDVIEAPLGKGAAMAAAFGRCADGYLCFLDADYEHSDQNIAAELRETAIRTGADMVVAEFIEPTRRLAVTPTIYWPILRALFPDLVDHQVAVPLSGFRILRANLPVGALPSGYGAETHLNVVVPALGGTVRNHPVGLFRGKVRGYTNIPAIGRDVGAALLDQAERSGRLTGDRRPEWDRWVDDIVRALSDQPPVGADDRDYVNRLLALADRPLPPAEQR